MIEYQVQIQLKKTMSEYYPAIDITDDIELSQLGNINKSIDAREYDFGLFTYGDVQIECDNSSGKYNEFDSRSIFQNRRHNSKVTIALYKNNKFVHSFQGLLYDPATRLDILQDTIRFRLLSYESLMGSIAVPGGQIVNGMGLQDALKAILSISQISSKLSIGELQIDNDIKIKDGRSLNGVSVFDAVSKLLLVSNTIMYIYEDKIYIVPREVDLGLHKRYMFDRSKIIDLKNYNNGQHRLFTAIKINDHLETDDVLIDIYGLKVKKIEAKFLRGEDEYRVARNILNEFKKERIELEITVNTEDALGISLLDYVNISLPLYTVPKKNNFIPVVGVSRVGVDLIPEVRGSVEISPRIDFRVFEVNENPGDLTTTLKLREYKYGRNNA